MASFDDTRSNELLESAARKEQEDVAKILASRYGFSYIDLSSFSIDPSALALIREEDARRYRMVGFLKEGKIIHFASETADNDGIREALSQIKSLGYQVERYLVSTPSIEYALLRYTELHAGENVRRGEVDLSPERISKLMPTMLSLEHVTSIFKKLEDGSAERRLSEILEIILASALALDASDIHLEPEQNGTRVRLRLQGILRDVGTLQDTTYRYLLSRIKLISGIKLNVRDKPQDGRFSVTIKNRTTEVRTSVIPDAEGESIVLRVLNPEKGELGLDTLGMPEALIERIRSEIKRPNGMIITTGPTGSGKTTALYALMRELYTPDIKIITIENPVEYRLPGITQTQVDEKELTFATALRATLRQDPDVIMIGEVRDPDVAATAINAALTGHLVFTTLHTNSAAGAFPRLVDLGIDPKTTGSAVNLVLGQRLIRTLGKGRGTPVPLTGALRSQFEAIVHKIPNQRIIPPFPEVIYKAASDDDYDNRFGVYEYIMMDADLASYIRENPSVFDIEAYVRKTQQMSSLMEDAVLKVLKGVTTIEEIERVVGPLPKE
jgi:type IV pilus assembly protein PilB